MLYGLPKTLLTNKHITREVLHYNNLTVRPYIYGLWNACLDFFEIRIRMSLR